MRRITQLTLKFSLFIFILILLWYAGRFFKIDPQKLEGYLYKFSIVKAALIFILLYVAVTFFVWLSKDVFKIVSAIIFGAALSSLFIWIAEALNALILFHLSRYLGKEFAEKKLFRNKAPKWEEVLMRQKGFWSLLFFRAVPLIPFRFLDLFMGLTPISFKKYISVVILGSPLRIYWLQYILAAVGKDIFKGPNVLMQYLLANKPAFILSLIYLILVVVVGFKLGGKK